MCWRPSGFPLFPYTTLFRSSVEPKIDLLDAGDLTRVLAARVPGFRSLRSCERLSGGASQDRKSTRLNSSHRCSSYAVFCLKKKTNLYLSKALGRHAWLLSIA